jgi:hypothetical protein
LREVDQYPHIIDFVVALCGFLGHISHGSEGRCPAVCFLHILEVDMKLTPSLLVAVVLSCCVSAWSARADLVTATPQLPPDGSRYVGSFFDVFVELDLGTGPAPWPISGHIELTKTSGGPWAVDSFFDVFVELDLLGGIRTLSGSGAQAVAPLLPGLPSPGVIDTEMLAMNLVGGPPILPPSLPTIPLLLRESPTRASLGKTTITPMGGGYHLLSFFDIFTELSIDGGATWAPVRQQGSGDEAPLRVNLAAVPVPAAAWTGLLLLSGIVLPRLWRRRAA